MGTFLEAPVAFLVSMGDDGALRFFLSSGVGLLAAAVNFLVPAEVAIFSLLVDEDGVTIGKEKMNNTLHVK